jgi:hypothetical protein
MCSTNPSDDVVINFNIFTIVAKSVMLFTHSASTLLTDFQSPVTAILAVCRLVLPVTIL